MITAQDAPTTQPPEEGINQLEQQLIIELDELEAKLQDSTKKYRTWKGLAITGYSFTGMGVSFVIVDALAATNTEDPNSSNKFEKLSWSAIPFILLGTSMAVTFKILEDKENERRLITESELYDVKGELELLQIQLYGEENIEESSQEDQSDEAAAEVPQQPDLDRESTVEP